jgi:hypothetical protein
MNETLPYPNHELIVVETSGFGYLSDFKSGQAAPNRFVA